MSTVGMRARLFPPTRRARLVQQWRDGLPAPCDALLAAAALAYRAGLAIREAGYATGVLRTRSLPCAVVAVGNLTVGGTGKTPLVEHLARELTTRGRAVVVLSRGYGRRRASGLQLVSDGGGARLSAAEAGDEPVLLARRLPGVPIVVGADRHRAGAFALGRFRTDLLLLDDAFQQRRLRADLNIVCLDARAPWGRRGLLPRGTLREPVAAIARAHLVVVSHVTEAPPEPVEAEIRDRAPGVPIARAHYEPQGFDDLRTGQPVPREVLAGRPVLAFAGIATPAGFAATLARTPVRPRALVPFPDHHPYDAADLADLETRARHVGAEALVTTEKDAVRLPAGGSLPIWSLRVRLRLEDPGGAWWRVLDARLAGR